MRGFISRKVLLPQRYTKNLNRGKRPCHTSQAKFLTRIESDSFASETSD